MLLIQNEKELVAAFRPRDQRTLELPTTISFPILIRDSFAWIEPTGIRTFVVFENDVSNKPMGIAFRRDGASSTGSSHLCDWCHCVGADVGLLTTDKNSKRRLGVLLCRDLNCPAKLDEAADLSGTSSIGPRRRMLERMQRFAHEGLGIEDVP